MRKGAWGVFLGSGLLGLLLAMGTTTSLAEERQCGSWGLDHKGTFGGSCGVTVPPGTQPPGGGGPGAQATPVTTQVPGKQQTGQTPVVTPSAVVPPGPAGTVTPIVRPGQTPPPRTPTPPPQIPTPPAFTPTPCPTAVTATRSLDCLPPDVQICVGPNGIPLACLPTPTPAVVPGGKGWIVDTQLIPGRDLQHCQEVTYYLDPRTGITINTQAREVPCPGVPPEGPACPGGLQFDGTTFRCVGQANAVRIEARVPIPEVTLTLDPFPASLVHWPNRLRLEPVDRPSTEAKIDRWPAGAGGECTGEGDDAGTPRDGTLKDITLRLWLMPYWQSRLDRPMPLQAALDFGPGGFVGGPAARVVETAGGPVMRGPRIPSNLLWVEEGDTLTFALSIPSHPAAQRYGYLIAPFPTTLDEEWARAGTPSFVFRVLPTWRLWYQFSYQIAEGIYRDEERTVGFTTVTGPDGNQYSVPIKKTERVRKGCNWKRVTEGPHSVATEQITGLAPCLFGQGAENACVWQDAIVTTKVRLAVPDGGAAYQTSDGVLYYIVREVQTLLVRPDLPTTLREWIRQHPEEWLRAIGR